MFNTDKDYNNSIQYAQAYTHTHSKSRTSKLFIFNIIALAFLGYMTYASFLGNESNFSLPSLKEGVLGVSETIDDSEVKDEKLMKILKTSSTIQSEPSYTEALATVLDDNDRSGFKGRIAVVNQETN